VINSMLAASMDWGRIGEMVAEAKSKDDPVARYIKTLNLKANQIVLALPDPADVDSSDSDSDSDSDSGSGSGSGSGSESGGGGGGGGSRAGKGKGMGKKKKQRKKPTAVEIDLGLSAYANSRKHYEKKKTSAIKQKKTIDASAHALESVGDVAVT
jgi:hypothetical protein